MLLGHYEAASSEIVAPSSMNYLAVRLKAGERWRYQPPAGHTVAWAALGEGELHAPDALQAGELAIFEESNGAIDFHAAVDTEFVLGSAVKHPHDLVTGLLLGPHQRRGAERGRGADPADRQPLARARPAALRNRPVAGL